MEPSCHIEMGMECHKYGVVCVVYDGCMGDYGEDDPNFARLFTISLPWMLSRALTF